MALAAHRRGRTTRLPAQFPAALVAALAGPAIALAVTAAPAAASGPIAVGANLFLRATSPGGPDPTVPPTEPPPTEPPPTAPPPTKPPPTEPPVDPTEPPVDPTAPATRPTGSPADPTGSPADPAKPPAEFLPAGPPVAGMTLSASEVVVYSSDRPAWLRIRLGNTGTRDATGSVELILPTDVRVSAPPAACRGTAGGRAACDFARVRAGRSVQVQLPISVTAEALRLAPLTGTVAGTLTPRAGSVKRTQVSFQITAAAMPNPPENAAATGTGDLLVAANGSSKNGAHEVQRLAISLITVSALLVVLALALAATSLRRRLADEPPPAPLGPPAAAD